MVPALCFSCRRLRQTLRQQHDDKSRGEIARHDSRSATNQDIGALACLTVFSFSSALVFVAIIAATLRGAATSSTGREGRRDRP